MNRKYRVILTDPFGFKYPLVSSDAEGMTIPGVFSKSEAEKFAKEIETNHPGLKAEVVGV
jgi:hypothetical protein